MPPRRLEAAELRKIAQAAGPSRLQATCACRLHAATAWVSITEERWPAALMELLGTLRDPAIDEPTFEEFHPNGTRYDSPDAPIALPFFPFNRCDVYRCRKCSLPVLRYTEYGGYYVDHRVRRIMPSVLIV